MAGFLFDHLISHATYDCRGRTNFTMLRARRPDTIPSENEGSVFTPHELLKYVKQCILLGKSPDGESKSVPGLDILNEEKFMFVKRIKERIKELMDPVIAQDFEKASNKLLLLTQGR
jgi:hypothetical protein